MRVLTDGNGSAVRVRFKRRPRASCQDWLPHAPSGSWVEAEVVVPVRGHLPQRMRQLHRDAPGAVLPVAGPQRGQRPCAVEVAGKASFSGPPPLPAEVQGHSAAARGLQVHFNAPCGSLWHHLVSGRGGGAGVPIHTRVWWDWGSWWACPCSIYHRSWHIVSTQPTFGQPVSECHSSSVCCSEETWRHKRIRGSLGRQAKCLRQMDNRYEWTRWWCWNQRAVCLSISPAICFNCIDQTQTKPGVPAPVLLSSLFVLRILPSLVDVYAFVYKDICVHMCTHPCMSAVISLWDKLIVMRFWSLLSVPPRFFQACIGLSWKKEKKQRCWI